jgi:WD40 repeat protein
MDTSQFRGNQKITFIAGGVLLLLGFGLGLLLRGLFPTQIPASSPIPSSAVGLLQTNTSTVLPATNTPIVITPTSTASLPQPTQAESSLPAVFLARLTLGEIQAIALSPHLDRLIVASASHTCLFTTESYERIWCRLSIPQIQMAELGMGSLDPQIRGLAFRPDGGQVAITLWNGYLVFLDTTDGEQVNIIPTGRWLFNLAWSLDGKRIITHSYKGGIEVWDSTSGEFLQQLAVDPESLTTMAWSADGTVFATADKENVITFWDGEKYEPTGNLAVQTTGWINIMAWSPDKSKIYAGIATPMPCEENCDPNDPEYKGWVASWFVDSGHLASKTSVGDIVKTLSVSPDGKRVAAGGELVGSFIVLDGASSRISARLTNTNAGKGLGWLDNNRALFLPDPGHVDAMSLSEWDVRKSEHAEIFLPGYENLRSMAWLPGGDRILTNSAGGTLSFWQPRTGQRLDQFQLSFGDLPITEFGPTWISPVDPWLAVVSKDSLAIVDLETRQVLKWLDHQQIAPRVRLVDFVWSQDGRKIAGVVGYLDRAGLTAAVWDPVTGELLFKASEEDNADIYALSFSPDGRRLVLTKDIGYPQYKHSLVVVEIYSGEEVQSLDSETQVFWVYWLSPDRIAFDGCDRTLIWDLAQGIQIESTLPSRSPAVRPDGKLAAFPCPGEGISIWGFPDGKEVGCLLGQSDRFGYRSLFFSPDGALLASLTDGGSLIVWDTSEFP